MSSRPVPLPAAKVLTEWDALKGDEVSAAVVAAHRVVP